MLFYGFEDGGTHAVVACVLLGLLATKVLAVRLGGRPGYLLPIIGSVLFAVAIVAIAIAVVTAHFGPTSSAELEAQEERLQQRIELREEALEQREEREEERGR
jgi:hypothetical protein